MRSCMRSEGRIASQYRIAVMGPAAVGKSAIVHQFLYGKFQPDYKKTVEDMHSKEFDLDGTKITLELLDTAGAYTFPSMRRLAIATSHAFVLVYSQDDKDSFREVTELRDVIIAQRETEEVPIVIVANKADCETTNNRCERLETVETECAIANVDWNNGFVSASAKKGNNVVAIFAEVLRLLSQEKTDVSEALMKRWLSLSDLHNKDRKRSLNPKRSSFFRRTK
ncbi:Ras-related protein RABD2a [Elysia marginata]|uniref:Ras-related protein RABD2a n=1 Tax=Elysia marginata TaxID=1093978 RepID=A0AAV4G152_9GAST|nr:Ras-related protein RABD2a [Elysia marginata]